MKTLNLGADQPKLTASNISPPFDDPFLFDHFSLIYWWRRKNEKEVAEGAA